MIISLLGPPGSGKGTQAELIRKNLGFSKISIGDMLREAIKTKDEIGKKAKKYLEKGKLVPDYLIIKMIRKELENGKARRDIVFDGFPRNMNQAISLDRFLSSRGGKVDLILYFDTPLSLVASRLSQRRICPKCGALYNLESAQPSVQNICDDCGSTLVKREDDNEGIIKSRFQVYEEETAPVKDFYRKKDLLINIDGTNKKEEIWNEVKRYIEKGFHRENCN